MKVLVTKRNAIRTSSEIYAMAFDRSTALKHLTKHSEPLLEHIIKCCIYKDIRSQDMHHWIYEEMCRWLERASEIKGKRFKLKKSDYLKTLFVEFGDSPVDYKIVLEDFRDEHCGSVEDPYPYFDITPDVVDYVYSIATNLMNVAIPKLAAKEPISKDEWYQLINPLFYR